MSKELFSSSELEELKNDFIIEASEHLQIASEDILNLEKYYNNYEKLNEVFRAIHSIKGAAAYLALNSIVEVSHVMETVLDKLRQGEIRVTKELIDYLLQGIDILVELIEETSNNESSEKCFSQFISKGQGFSDLLHNSLENEKTLEKIEEARDIKEENTIFNLKEETDLKKETKKISSNNEEDIESILEDSEEAASNQRFIVFQLEGQNFGINISSVKEIVKITEITEIPFSNNDVIGIMNLRGEIITIIDLKVKLSMKNLTEGKRRIIILNKEQSQLGILVDAVKEVRTARVEDIKPPVVDKEFDVDYIYGIVETDYDFTILLNIDKIIA